MWREIHPFIDASGKIKKGLGAIERYVALGVLEKQLFREKVLFKCMFNPHKVSELDHLATASGIGANEGLLDEPPDDYL